MHVVGVTRQCGCGTFTVGRRCYWRDRSALGVLGYSISMAKEVKNCTSLLLVSTGPSRSNLERVRRSCTTTNVPIGYNWTPQIAPSPSTITTLSDTPISGPTHSPPQTAAGSTQPFCHSTLSGQTDRQTDRWCRQQICNS